jgi:hypothetical protein
MFVVDPSFPRARPLTFLFTPTGPLRLPRFGTLLSLRCPANEGFQSTFQFLYRQARGTPFPYP